MNPTTTSTTPEPEAEGPGEPERHLAGLTAAIMQVLQVVDQALTAHRADGCPWCDASSRRACPMLGLIAAALDLIVRSWRIKKGLRHDPSGHAPRDLYAALRSGWLSDAESATLTEILSMLDLATAQANAAGVNLPKLAGIGIAIIDGYRIAVAGPGTVAR